MKAEQDASIENQSDKAQENQEEVLPIEAGLNLEKSVAKELFLGHILEENLFPFPKFDDEEAETLRIVIDSVSKFLDGKDELFREFDAQAQQTDEYIQSLRELGLFGLIIPEEYGGIGLSNSAYSRVLQQSSKYDASTSLTVGAHSSIGMKGLLLFGTDEQKQRYLPRLATGEMIAAFCLTEPGAGSDAASISTTAKKQSDGSWILNGEKIWITNGAFAEFFTVFARTDSEQGKISAFIVERSFGGVSSGPKEDKLGIRASATTTVNFDGVQVPAENLLGEEGHGFKIAMEILNTGRTGLGGGCVGGMKACIARASQQATERKQFDRPIAEFGLIQEKIAQMTVECYAAESVVAMVGHYIDSGVADYSVEAAISKVYCTEALWYSVNEALQVAGGNGYMKEYPYERMVRDSRINMIFEGTNEILRLYIALSGLKDTGEVLKDFSKGFQNIFNDPIKGFGVLSTYASSKFSQLTSFGRDRLVSVPDTLRAEAQVFERATLDFARASETLLRRYGKNIIGKQFSMKRISETIVDLFVGMCVLSRVSQAIRERGEEKCVDEIRIARIFAQQAKRRMAQNIEQIESKNNVDEELKGLAASIFEEKRYPWDVL